MPLPLHFGLAQFVRVGRRVQTERLECATERLEVFSHVRALA